MRTVSDMLDVIVEPRYDTQTIPAAGATLLTYFAVPIGSGATNFGAATIAKNLADTNMDLASQLPAGYNFTLLGFRIMPTFNVTQADITLAFNAAVFTFTIGSKPYLRTPVRTIPAGNGPSGFYTQAAAATAAIVSNGWPMLTNGFSIGRKPLLLQQTQNFQATITWPVAAVAVTTTIAGQGTAGLPVTVFLDGFLKRIVQ